MKRGISSGGRIAVAAMYLMVTGSVAAQTVDQILRAGQQRLDFAQQSQERINGIVEGTRSLEDQYRSINKEIDGLRVYNRLMEAQTQGQAAVLEDIALSIDQVDVINRQIFPLMERMIDGLESFVSLDVPFLMVERRNRVVNLNDIMARSDVSVAEKFRKVIEAYQIENEYGSSSEWYEETFDIGDGVSRQYNVLRIGRIGLYAQSDDGRVTARWDMNEKRWTEDSSARSEIRKGMRMARQLIAPEIIVIPVSHPRETS